MLVQAYLKDKPLRKSNPFLATSCLTKSEQCTEINDSVITLGEKKIIFAFNLLKMMEKSWKKRCFNVVVFLKEKRSIIVVKGLTFILI